jgi:hypothetical protein
MIVNAFKCITCGDITYSRCPEDINTCCCERVSIRNGYDHPIVAVDGEDLLCPNIIQLQINATPEMLYWDWNLFTNHFGYQSDFANEPQLNKTELCPTSYLKS